jgi:hypothetical protein
MKVSFLDDHAVFVSLISYPVILIYECLNQFHENLFACHGIMDLSQRYASWNPPVSLCVICISHSPILFHGVVRN